MHVTEDTPSVWPWRAAVIDARGAFAAQAVAQDSLQAGSVETSAQVRQV